MNKNQQLIAAIHEYKYGKDYSQRFKSPQSYQSELDREVIITPFDGNYGQAGLVITVNGSPPKGIILVIGKTESIYIQNNLGGWDRVYDKYSSMFRFKYTSKKGKLALAVMTLIEEKNEHET